MSTKHPLTLAQLASSDHRFTSGTAGNPGRLIIQDILPHEVKQYHHIFTDKDNNRFAWADPSWDGITERELKHVVSKEYAAARTMVFLFVVLKPDAEVNMKPRLEFKPKRLPYLINSGVVIGCLDFQFETHPHDPSERAAYIGIMIHHQVNGRGFGKETLITALDYALLGKPVLHNGNLLGLGVDKVFIETKEINVGLRGLMASLHLNHLEREGTPDHGQEDRMQGPTTTYTVTKAHWLEARKHITMKWRPAGHQTLSRDGSPDLQELEKFQSGPATGFGEASSSGQTSVSGHPSSSQHTHHVQLRHQRFGYGHLK